MKSALPHVLLAVYVTVCLAAITWPLYGWVDSNVSATVLGLPFVFAWNIAWVLASFIALVLYHTAVERRERE